MARVLEKMLLLFAVIALPALLLLRRSGRALRRLTDAARGPVGSVIPQPLPVEGPKDVRQLTESFNSMRTRIATMIEDRNVMLGAVGHDLRTPLTALRLEAEGVADPDSRTALVKQIEAIAGQLDEIIRLARYGQPVVDPERLDVSRIIRNLVDIRYAATRDLIVLSGAGPAQVEGDPTALARMVQNLIDNALRYGERAEVTVGRSGQSALLIVGDRGPGISSGRIADAVRPFGRLEPSRNVDMGGHGLGLAIVEQVVRAHGGEWSVANRAGGGLEVRVLLPLAPDDASITLGA
jgi:signal transduction histidine kinase